MTLFKKSLKLNIEKLEEKIILYKQNTCVQSKEKKHEAPQGKENNYKNKTIKDKEPERATMVASSNGDDPDENKPRKNIKGGCQGSGDYLGQNLDEDVPQELIDAIPDDISIISNVTDDDDDESLNIFDNNNAILDDDDDELNQAVSLNLHELDQNLNQNSLLENLHLNEAINPNHENLDESALGNILDDLPNQ